MTRFDSLCARVFNFAWRTSLWVFAVVLIGSASFVSAHESRPSYLSLTEISSGTYEMVWKVPAKGRSAKLALSVIFSDPVEVVVPVRAGYTGGASVERSTIRCAGGLEGTTITIVGLESTLTDGLVRVQNMEGGVQTGRVSPENPAFEIQENPTSGEVARIYSVLGITHIWAGLDHLLFVACLILVAGRGRRLLATVTGFTVAHSVTLALAALDLVRIPVPPVEAVIALSIVFLAMELARSKRDSLTFRYPIAVSSFFGLLHGFGFAAVLQQIGLPQTEIPVALLFFNVGVEIGQLLFIAALFAGFAALAYVIPAFRRETFLFNGKRLAVYVIGTAASYWMVERVTGFWA